MRSPNSTIVTETTNSAQQEMEKERVAKEAAEKEREERAKYIKEQFSDAGSQWEKDKAEIQNLAKEAKDEAKAPAGKAAAGQQGSKDAPKAAKNNNPQRPES